MQLKNSVYALPNSKSSQKSFGDIVLEITSGAGEAFFCVSKIELGLSDSEIVSLFNADRKSRYDAIANELRALLKFFPNPSEEDLMGVEHALGKFERQLAELLKIDFFKSPQGPMTQKLLQTLKSKTENKKSPHLSKPIQHAAIADYQKKIWVTRAGIHIDRMACAWLIDRFIDPGAKFKFVSDSKYKPRKNEIRFDMFDGEFGHIGDDCTFETLVQAFPSALTTNSHPLQAIAELIHDLDLKDSKFNRPETAGVALILSGIASTEPSDHRRLERASAFFDELLGSLRPLKNRLP